MIKKILLISLCIFNFCLISCKEKKSYDEAFVIDIMNREDSVKFEQNKLLTEFNIKPDSKKYTKYQEFKESLLSDPSFFERNNETSDLWVNYTAFTENFETAFKAGRYNIFDFPGISNDDFLLIFGKGRPSDFLLKTYNKFTDLEKARIEIWKTESFQKILDDIAKDDLQIARSLLVKGNYQSAEAAYNMINIEHILPQSEYDYILNTGRNFAKANKQKEMFAVYNIVDSLDNSKFTGEDLYNKANFTSASKYEKNHLFKKAYEKYVEDGISAGKIFEYVEKAALWCNDMDDGFEAYGGDWSLYQIDNRVEKKVLKKEQLSKDYKNQMQHIFLNENGTIETYSKNYKNFFWEYSQKDGLLIKHWNSDEKHYENCGGLNSQGYIAINGMTIMNNSAPAYVSFFFTKN